MIEEGQTEVKSVVCFFILSVSSLVSSVKDSDGAEAMKFAADTYINHVSDVF